MTVGGPTDDLRDLRCLVTGASGFVGSALCKHLTARGADVWALGRRKEPAPGPLRWISCDVTDRSQVDNAVGISRPEAVFHLASIVSGARKLDLVLPMLHSNLTGFVNVAVAAAEADCRRIVTVGSLQEPDQVPLGVPSSPYAAAKFAASAYGRMLAGVFGVPVVIARLFMTYGPGQNDVSKVVPYVLSELLAGRKPALSSGTHAYDWVYIDDVCEALIACATSEGVAGKTIDVGTGVLTRVVDVARGLARRVNQPAALRIGALPDRVGDPTRAADVVATKALIGWQARVGVEQGLDLTARWYSDRSAAERDS